MFKFLWLFFAFIGAANAVPVLKISAASDQLAFNETTTVTFTWSEAVTGFTLSDVNVLPAAGGILSSFSGSGTTYTATFQKKNGSSTSLIVDNNNTSPTGVGAAFGFNKAPVYYVNNPTLFSTNKIKAVPQPRCALPGEVLANPSSAVVEKFYTLESTAANSLYFNEARLTCLVRLAADQRWDVNPTPKAWDAISPHGVHNHSALMPKVTNQEMIRVNGTTKILVRPQNHDCDFDLMEGHCYDIGAWRVNFIPAKMDKDDPIVYPGQKGAAHHHTFYGNTTINYLSNAASLVKDCNSVAAGGAANCTGYWAPSMIDTAISLALKPQRIIVYYKAGVYTGMTEPLPQGLKIIAGNPANASTSDPDNRHYNCVDTNTNTRGSDSWDIPVCGANDTQLELAMSFPTCAQDDGFGGIKLDSPNHRSHLQYQHNPTDGTFLGSPIQSNWCTAAFPHQIPEITVIVTYEIKKGQNTGNWRLSSDNYASSIPGGRSLHADWWGGWDERFANRMVDNCTNMPMDCGVNFMGLNAGIPITSITAVGTTGTITTAVPHLLPIGTIPWTVWHGTKIKGRISGISGTDAAMYNFDATSTNVLRPNAFTGGNTVIPVGTQELTVTGANTITYTLSGTPSDLSKTAGEVTGAKLQWGEELCEVGTVCPSAYSDFYYPKQ